MRLWSLDPRYLDSRGLVAVWREGLLAKKVLQGKLRGYQHHPQLVRFRAQPDPVAAINTYLSKIIVEATWRGYHFDPSKIKGDLIAYQIPVTEGQLQFEFSHLLEKLRFRSPYQYAKLQSIKDVHPHPLFHRIDGKQEPWEKSMPR